MNSTSLRHSGTSAGEYAAALIVGCGYLGRRVAARLLDQGREIAGLVRSPDSAQRLRELGVPPLVVDLDHAAPADILQAPFGEIYYLAPPPGQGNRDPRLQTYLARRTDRPPRRIVYVSTTGVYGDAGGAWITEQSATHAGTERARRRLWAENQLREWCTERGVDWVILRVPGIYGPGRLPVARIRSGAPMVRPQEAPYTNRIHCEDLADICVAAMERAPGGAIYNATDGTPGTLTDYFSQVADLLGLPQPALLSLAEAKRQLGPGMASYLGESRRISNRRLIEELGIELRYPTLKQGLPASL